MHIHINCQGREVEVVFLIMPHAYMRSILGGGGGDGGDGGDEEEEEEVEERDNK